MPLPRLAAVAAVATARAAIAFVLGLSFWATAPTLIGWEPTSVMSASMEPAIRVGDVVASRPVDADALRPGQVLLADDPDHADRLRLHRLASLGADGLLVTRGDANPTADSSPIRVGDVHGVGVLRVPWIGWPVVWARTNDLVPLALTVAGLFVCLSIALVRGDDDEPGAAPPSDDRRARRRRRALGLSLVAAIVAGGSTAPAWAAFSSSTVASGSIQAGRAMPPTQLRCENSFGAVVVWEQSGPPAQSYDLLVDGEVAATGIPGEARSARVPRDRFYWPFETARVTVRAHVSRNWSATSAESITVGGLLFGRPYCY